MWYYFRLQVIRVGRYFSDQGIHPLIGGLLLSGTFVISFLYLYHKFEFAGWIIALTAGSLLLKSSQPNHINFLESIYSKRWGQQIRVIEQFLVALPFLVVLIVHDDYLPTAAVMAITVLTSFVTLSVKTKQGIPTPFRRTPFEYIVGFRKTIYILPMSVFILFLSWHAHNENLAVVAIAFITFVVMSFSSKLEPPEYIWMHSKSPKKFLLHQLKTALVNAQVLILPCTIAAIILFPSFWSIYLIAHLVSMFFIGSILFAKYAAYPNEIGVAQALLLGLCLWFPPLLIVILPKFYFDGQKKLTVLLHD